MKNEVKQCEDSDANEKRKLKLNRFTYEVDLTYEDIEQMVIFQ